jgi:hypothetical protein
MQGMGCRAPRQPAPKRYTTGSHSPAGLHANHTNRRASPTGRASETSPGVDKNRPGPRLMPHLPEPALRR